MSETQSSTMPFLPPEIRAKIWAYTIEPKTLSRWDGTCFPRSDKSLPDVSDLFLEAPAPDEYPQYWYSREHWLSYFKREPGCQHHFISNETGQRTTCNSPTASKYCWSCNRDGRAILYLSRGFYEEAIKEAYANTTFSFENGEELVSFIRGVRSHGNSALVKHLEFKLTFPQGNGDLDYFFPTLRQDAIKRSFPNLATVAFKVARGSDKIERLRHEWFADVRMWGVLERSLRVIAPTLAEFDNLKVSVDGLASDYLAGWLAEAARTDYWLDRPLDHLDIAVHAAAERIEEEGGLLIV